MVLPIGISLQSRYRVIRSLSKGGMGQIFEIVDEAIPGCPAKVLKVLNGADSPMAATPPPDLVRRFKQEAEILQQLDCSGIPKIFPEDGYFCEAVDGHPVPIHCMVMEKIIGEDLETWVKNPQHQLSENLAIRWLEQLTQTLHYLHSHNIIHRDIKPSNIMLRPSGELVLIDFGISREMTDTYYARQQMDITGTLYGTLQYAPPEQTNGRAVPQSDFFALGRTIAYLLSKIPPPDTLKAQEPSLHWWQVRKSTLTPGLTNLLERMMQPSVARRPKTAIEILQAIARLKRDRDPAQRRREFPWVMLWSLASAGLCIGIRALGWMQPLELAAFDQFMRLRPTEPPDPRIVIITIDEADKEWQFAQGMRDLVPNQSLADAALKQLLLKLEHYQPRVIGLDLYRDFPVNQAYPELFELLGSDRLVALCKVTTSENDPSRPPPPEARLVGFSDVFPDFDGVVRQQPLGMKAPSKSRCNKEELSFSSEVTYRYLYDNHIIPTFASRQTKLGNRIFTHVKLPFGAYQRIDNTGGKQILLNYRASQNPLGIASSTLPLRDFLEKPIPPEWIKGKIVLIGINDPLKDNYKTPIGNLPGVAIHAHMISHLLSAVEDNRLLLWIWHPSIESIWIFTWATISGFVTWTIRQLLLAMLTVTGILLALSISCLGVFLLLGGWIPLIPPVAAILLTGAGATAWRYLSVYTLFTHLPCSLSKS